MKLRFHVLILLLLTAAAFDLRLHGADWGLPVALEQDNKIPMQVEMLREGVEDPTSDREFNWYPTLLAHCVTLLPEPVTPPLDAPLARHLEVAGKTHSQTRSVMAFFAMLAVPLTWILARLWLSRGGAYVAALFVATSLLHVSFSQQARPHAPSGTFFLLAVLAAVWVRRGRGWGPHAAAFFAALLSVGCLQSGPLVLPALIVAYATREGGARRLRDGRVLVPLAGAAAAVLLFYPFLFAGGVEESEGVINLGGHLIFLDQFNGSGFPITLRTIWSYDPTLLVLIALAVVVALARRPASDGLARRGDLLVVAAFVLPYFVVTGLYERNYERFVIPLVPYFACLAAWAVWNVLPRYRVALASAALVLPVYASFRLAAVRAAPHTMQRAGRWVEQNLKVTDDIVLTTLVDLPLARRPEGLIYWGVPPVERRHYHLPWSRYQARRPEGHGPEPMYRLRWISTDIGRYVADTAGFLAEQGGDYAVVEVFADNRVHRIGTDITEFFRANGELLARFSPDGDPHFSEHPFGSQDETSVPTPHFTRRLLQAEGTGPVIEIFRLRK